MPNPDGTHAFVQAPLITIRHAGRCRDCGRLEDDASHAVPVPAPLPAPGEDEVVRCTCGFPNVVARNMSGHSEDCPVYWQWAKKVFGTQGTEELGLQKFEPRTESVIAAGASEVGAAGAASAISAGLQERLRQRDQMAALALEMRGRGVEVFISRHKEDGTLRLFKAGSITSDEPAGYADARVVVKIRVVRKPPQGVSEDYIVILTVNRTDLDAPDAELKLVRAAYEFRN
jgi:hypothetical protein